MEGRGAALEKLLKDSRHLLVKLIKEYLIDGDVFRNDLEELFPTDRAKLIKLVKAVKRAKGKKIEEFLLDKADELDEIDFIYEIADYVIDIISAEMTQYRRAEK